MCRIWTIFSYPYTQRFPVFTIFLSLRFYLYVYLPKPRFQGLWTRCTRCPWTAWSCCTWSIERPWPCPQSWKTPRDLWPVFSATAAWRRQSSRPFPRDWALRVASSCCNPIRWVICPSSGTDILSKAEKESVACPCCDFCGPLNVLNPYNKSGYQKCFIAKYRIFSAKVFGWLLKKCCQFLRLKFSKNFFCDIL